MLSNKRSIQGRQILQQTSSKRTFTRSSLIGASIAVLAVICVCVAFAAISLSTSTAYTQNFDGMGTSATATLPTDFRVDKPATVRTVGSFSAATTTTNLAGGANLSSSASNGIYNFGSGTTTTGPDRAVGFLSSGTATQSGNLYAQLMNNTGGNLSGVQISYDVEKYRNGSNPNGFRIQMFYSADGTTWTSAGSDFLTSFAADANNNGFTTAPGATVSVTNKTLSVSVPNGNNLYLAWNYSVSATSTTTNAQALAIDNVSILGIAGGGSTNPTGVGAANPNSVNPGATSLLTVAVTPGTNPTSTSHTVSANLTAIGGSANQPFFDDGINGGDVTAGDNTFSFNATVAIGTSGGVKNLPATITETSPLSRTGSASISLTVVTPTSPTGVGAANPSSVDAGNSSLLTVTVTPGANPTSTGLAVSANLSSIGGSSSQQFFDDGSNGDVTPGNNVFSYNATVTVATTPGVKSLPFAITDAQVRSGSGNISLTVSQPPVAPGTIVISQLYGGGGNNGATYTNDFIEIFNRGNTTVSLAGWSVQYTSSGATGSWSRTPLTGTLAPGQYYLVQESQGAGGTTPLPTPDATGTIAMAAGSGHIALVTNNTNLPSGCPNALPQLMDLVGYGTAACFEGAGPAPLLDNVTADFRSHLGCKDTDSNGGNFFSGSPNPRNSSTTATVCPVGDFEPEIFGTSPANNETHVPNNGNITINFDEPVNVTGSWFQISCTTTGLHTATVGGTSTSIILDPDTDFGFNEPCTVTIYASQVTDQDFIDPPDNLAADYVFSFNSEFFRDPAEHMVMGNPSNATTNVAEMNNYLMMKIQYALSYNNDREIPNWTSWHLDSTWRGSAPRVDLFRNDDTLPAGFHQVGGDDYSGSGFDRGHMCPSADRTSTPTDNAATFFMTNMVPQGPGNNQGPWANLENALRTFLPGNELYILSGGQGVGGIGSNGPLSVLASGVTVPAETWKAGLILPVGDNDVSRVDTNTRIIAVIMPNDDGIRFDQWQKYLATVDQIEALTGYDLYSNVPTATQDVIEARVDAANDTAPVTVDQTKTVAEDGSVGVTLAATDFNVNNVFTYTIVDQPLHGSVLCTAANCTYSPAAHYFGPDSFTFKANDSALDSNVSTVNITVTEINNDPSAENDNKQTAEDSSLNFAASGLTSNDSAGPGESAQTLTVDSIISTPNTHGSINLSAGQITYNPDTNYNGPASFDYHVCDDGTTNGAPDSKCAIGTVNVTVTEVNDTPSAIDDSKTTNEDTQLSFAASDLTGNDSAGPANENSQTLTVSSVTVTATTHGTVSLSSGQVIYTPAGNYNGPASFEYEVCDDGTTAGAPESKCATGTVNVTVSAVNDDPDAVDDSATIAEDSGANSINVRANDSDIDSDTLTVTLVTQGTHGSVAITGGTSVSYTPNANFFGTDTFTYTVSDGNGGTDTATVTVTVTNVEDAPDAVNDSATIAEDSGANAIDVRANDNDVDGDTLAVTAITQGTHGSVAITGGGTGVSYTPAANFFGSDSFTYTVDDGHGGSDTATVSITITNVNDAPVANNDSYATNSNTTLNVPAPGVLGNDSDIDGPSLSSQLVANVSHGTLALQGDGSFTYSPSLDFEGTDSFTYHAYDGALYSNVVTVTITVHDTVAPVLTSSVAISLISSTNSNLVNVGLAASATDNSGDPVTIQVAVFGDEDDQTPTANNVLHSPDAKDIAPITLRLRGERVEANDGRVYLIIITATDSSGNISRNYQSVVVPKNNKQASIDSVNAQAAAAVSYAQGHGGAPPPGYFVIGDGPIIGPKQ